MDLSDLRAQYTDRGLDRGDLDADPIAQFEVWFAEVLAAGYWEPNAMVVSTVDSDGWPEGRNVLLKNVDQRGFVFYTNYGSAKAAGIAQTGRAGLTFSWIELLRQVRVRGTVTRVEASESDAYFASRPRASQLGAWASDQSAVIESRDQLQRQFDAIAVRFEGGPVPRPPHWGGFLVGPEAVEFWQGRPDRLHDRFLYRRHGDGWAIDRLSP